MLKIKLVIICFLLLSINFLPMMKVSSSSKKSFVSPTLQSFPITLVPISTGFNGPIGIDYHPILNKVVVSVNFPSGQPRNFETISADGSHNPFSSVNGLTEELKIAIAQNDNNGMSIGGFPAGTLFSGTGTPGHILKVASDGNSFLNPWVTLPGETGLLRGSLYVDRTGVFSGDLIVVTTTGNVWRINSSGQPTKLASIGTHLEGLITVPNDVNKYGPWAGKILIGAEDQSKFYTVDTLGAVQSYSFPIPNSTGMIKPEDIDLIPANENFFAVNYSGSKIIGVSGTAFAGMEGDILVTQEFPGNLYRFHWNKLYFEITLLAVSVGQFEHVTFSKSGIVEVPGIGDVEFSNATYQVSENVGTALINVKRTGTVNAYATVDYTALETNAISPTHFLSTSGRLFFAPGETTKAFSVTIVNDNVKDCNKSLTLKLSNPTQAALGSINTATLSITDDD